MTTSTVHKVTHNINGFGTATHVFFDRHFHLPSMKILPGEYYGSGEDIIVNTVLGSCVSACIWDKKTGMGGMNHFMLPDTDEKDFDLLYDELTINEIDILKKQYKKDKPFLETICVESLIKELVFYNKVI
jgi:chemotaxis protein CheD